MIPGGFSNFIEHKKRNNKDEKISEIYIPAFVVIYNKDESMLADVDISSIDLVDEQVIIKIDL